MKWKSKSHSIEVHGIEKQIPRNSLVLIMLAQAAVIMPHIKQLSPWIIFLGLGCAWWRWMIFRDRFKFPPWWLKAILVLSSGAIILATEGIQHRLETWTSFLIVAFALKLIETKTRRDAYSVIFLACFVIATEFIYTQTILVTFYQCVALIIVIAAMIGMNQHHTRINIFSSLKLATKLFLQAIPLMLVVFVLFPRITPFWSVPTANTARTGLSSEMTPGEIAQLTRSDEIAFRAVFTGKTPEPHELYWRGLVFSHYSNGTWSQGDLPFTRRKDRLIDWSNDQTTRSFVPDVENLQKFSYQILQEPTDKIWRFGIDLAIPKPGDNGLTWDFRVISKRPMVTLTRYRIDSYPDAKLDQSLPAWSRNRETKLPEGDNLRIIAYAKDLHQKASSDRQYIEQLLREIRTFNFRYTLRPPILSRSNAVDQFWFDTQAGFCMHYAGALAYMLRAVDIPARVVGGYQGGEINPVTGHVVVRQYHAHAWVEAWLPGEGWQRFDPTAAIAPERIEQGLDAALAEDERDVLSAFTNVRLGQAILAARLLYLFESFEHRWNMFVVGYDSDRQSDTLQKILGKVTPLRVALVFLIGVALSFALAGLSIFIQYRKRVVHPVVKLLQRFIHDLNGRGFEHQTQESPMQYIKRICTEKGLAENKYLPLVNKLQLMLYASTTTTEKSQLQELKKDFFQLKRALFSA